MVLRICNEMLRDRLTIAILFFCFGSELLAVELYAPDPGAESDMVLLCQQEDRLVIYEPNGNEIDATIGQEIGFHMERWSRERNGSYSIRGTHPDEDCGGLQEYLKFLHPEIYDFWGYEEYFGPQSEL